MSPDQRPERRLTRTEEINLLLDWNSETFNAKVRNTDLLLAADDIGAAVILANLQKLEEEQRAWKHAAEMLFLADVFAYCARATDNTKAMPPPSESMCPGGDRGPNEART